MAQTGSSAQPAAPAQAQPAQAAAVLAANQSVPDLRDRKLGWFEEVKSARVSCG